MAKSQNQIYKFMNKNYFFRLFLMMKEASFCFFLNQKETNIEKIAKEGTRRGSQCRTDKKITNQNSIDISYY